MNNENFQTVILDKTGKKSFGICVVRGEVKDSPNTKETGIFIKGIVPNSPAYMCGKLNVGDRILSLNNKDLQNANEITVMELIQNAGIKINLKIQTFTKIDFKSEELKKNGYKQNLNFGSANITQSSSTALVKNDVYQQSIRNKQSYVMDDDEEDTRDMTGRIRTEAGFEIDRSSAGNCKLNKQEKEKDKEQPDEFGYTMVKIMKRYNLFKDLRKIEIQRPPNSDLNIGLAGHKDPQKMACFIAGISPYGLLGKCDILPGDEILEVNGNVVQNRCHLNVSFIFKSLVDEKVTLIISRKKANDESMSVKPLKKFPPSVDDTKFIFEQFPNARTVRVKKDGFLGIMIIFGKHVEVGTGIFISDLREDSNAVEAGIKVGDMLLAVNKDVILESGYEETVSILKRAEGIINLVVMTLKTEDAIKAEKDSLEKAKLEAKTEAEKPQDPSTAEIKKNKNTNIEIKIERKPLGVIVTGGKNNFVNTGCIITHIYSDGQIAADNRLKIFDHIIEANGIQLNCSEMTTLKIHQIFHTTYDKLLTLQVYRADPFEVEKFSIELTKKPGKELGLSLAPNEYGCTISEIISTGYTEIENKLQKGDIITKLNGESLENRNFSECFAYFKGISGKTSIEITRPKPKCRSEASKTS